MIKKISWLKPLKISLLAFLLASLVLGAEVLAKSESSRKGRGNGNNNQAAMHMSGNIRERMRLTAETLNNNSEVRFKLEFPSDEVLKDKIIKDTLDKMQLSKDDIGRLLVIKEKEVMEAGDNFMAFLIGAQEVPPVVTNASATADFTLRRSDTELKFNLMVNNIENAASAHIHKGIPGQNGPIVANLFTGPAKIGMFSGLLAEGVIEADDLSGPLDGKPFSDLVDLLRSGQAYVNVHTTQNPGGEIRGQVMAINEEEKTEERLRVRARQRGDMTNVKADFRFGVAATVRTQIIDDIFSRLSELKADDIEDALELRTMSMANQARRDDHKNKDKRDDNGRRGSNRGRN